MNLEDICKQGKIIDRSLLTSSHQVAQQVQKLLSLPPELTYFCAIVLRGTQRKKKVEN
jgi:hypothetical protein